LKFNKIHRKRADIIRPLFIGQGYNPSVIFGDSKLLRCPKYSAAFALNILTAAPNLARFIVHRTRFTSFARFLFLKEMGLY
jgi:hypothetical protein